MKKIVLTFSLLATLLFVACNSYKNTATVATPPATTQAPAAPQKSVMTDQTSPEVKVTPMNTEKKVLPTKSKMPKFEAAPVTPDKGNR